MRAAVIGFTRSGCIYAGRIAEKLKTEGWEAESCGKCRAAEECGVQVLEESLNSWTEKQFGKCDALIFVGALGIAVRSIAPLVKSKLTDPAVICMDEQARFVISVLSGHVGGANELTERLAAWLGAVPVITTATDLHGKFAVDVFARKMGLTITEKELAKEVSAALLENRRVGFCSEVPVEGELPEGLTWENAPELGIAVCSDPGKMPFAKTLHLQPRRLVLGVGCRRGTPRESIQKLAEECLRDCGLSKDGVACLASVDLKSEEAGLLELAAQWNAEFVTFSAEKLKKAEYDGTFHDSAFVESVTGIGNICERAALLASGSSSLLLPKTARDGVTIAIAEKDFRISFSD